MLIDTIAHCRSPGTRCAWWTLADILDQSRVINLHLTLGYSQSWNNLLILFIGEFG